MEELTSLGDLLDLQVVDLEIDRLLERRQGLPELAAYRRAHNEGERLAAEVARSREEGKVLRLAIDKAEGELRMVEDKKAMEERRMYAGGLSARDLENLVQEVEMLGRKVGTFEEEILALLERQVDVSEMLEDSRVFRQLARGALHRLERLVRLHHDLEISPQGLQAVQHLLDRLEAMQDELWQLRRKLGRLE